MWPGKAILLHCEAHLRQCVSRIAGSEASATPPMLYHEDWPSAAEIRVRLGSRGEVGGKDRGGKGACLGGGGQNGAQGDKISRSSISYPLSLA